MKRFVVGETYLTADKEPWKVLFRAESPGYIEIVAVDKNDETHALEVFWCDLAGSECVETTGKKTEPLYATENSGPRGFQ